MIAVSDWTDPQRADPCVGARHIPHVGRRRVRLSTHSAAARRYFNTDAPDPRWSRFWEALAGIAANRPSVPVAAAASTGSTTWRLRLSEPRIGRDWRADLSYGRIFQKSA